MKVVIQVGEDKYLKSSIPFSLTNDIDSAEVWPDPKAAKAYCHENRRKIPSATLVQIDAQLDFDDVPRVRSKRSKVASHKEQE